MSLSGIQRGQGWRALANTVAGDITAVVRYLAPDAQGASSQLLGSGTVIGSIEDRWLITATAAALFDEVPLGSPQSTPAAEGGDRRYGAQALQSLRCALTVPERNGEILCRLGGAMISARVSERDIALVFVSLPQALPVGVLPIDLGAPPRPEESVLVAGFGLPDSAAAADARDANAGPHVPARRLLVREGFFGEFGAMTGRLRYPLYRHLIPLEPTMLGGPVIMHRELQPGAALRTLVAINSQDVPQVNGDASLRPELEGEGFATHVLALYAQQVLLPSGAWIPFLEAVRRGAVRSFGPEALRVAQRPRAHGFTQFYIEP